MRFTRMSGLSRGVPAVLVLGMLAGGVARPPVGAGSGGTWGKAREVTGFGTPNRGGNAQLASVSCASADNCSAGGQYLDRFNHFQAFVAGKVDGVWGKAQEISGVVTQNKNGYVLLNSVSCASAGNCTAAGQYLDRFNRYQAFVAGEVDGTWGKAAEVPGIAALNQGGTAALTSVSCASAGNCSAGGYYTDGSVNLQAFMTGEVDGTWGKAEKVPGTAALDQSGYAELSSVSCGSAGNCSAGGFYQDSSNSTSAFIVSETRR